MANGPAERLDHLTMARCVIDDALREWNRACFDGKDPGLLSDVQTRHLAMALKGAYEDGLADGRIVALNEWQDRLDKREQRDQM